MNPLSLAREFCLPFAEIVLMQGFGLWFSKVSEAKEFWQQQSISTLAKASGIEESSCRAILNKLESLAATRASSTERHGNIASLWCDQSVPTVAVSEHFFALSVLEKKNIKNASTPLLLLSNTSASLEFLWQWASEQPERALFYRIL